MYLLQVETAAQHVRNSEIRKRAVGGSAFWLLLYPSLYFGKLRSRCPYPAFRAFGQVGSVRRDGLFVLAPPLLLGLPAGAALGQDALQEPVGGLVVAALGAGKLRLGGDQRALAGGLEDAGAVAFQVGLDALQRGYGGVEAGELLLDLRHDAALLGEGG